jgi:succinyl-CoA synthetase beta subunit
MNNDIKEITDILKYLSIQFESENEQTLLDFSKLSGDDVEDLYKRKLIADFAIAKHLGILKKDLFLKIFNYKR